MLSQYIRRGAILLFTFVSCIQIQNTYSERKLRVEINPGCMLNGVNCTTWTNTSLIHFISDGANDSLHFIWSFKGAPSFILARTLPDANMQVNWTKYHEGNFSSIYFQGSQPMYTFGYSLSKVWIYDDKDDRVRIDKVNQSDVTGYDTRHFTWERQDYMSILNSADVELTFMSEAYGNHNLGPNGSFSISIRVKETDGYSEILPYMLHNSNMSQIDFDFSEVQMNYTKPNPEHTRVAFTITLVNGDEQPATSHKSGMRYENVETLDDEHTPGVFSTVNIRTPIFGQEDQSFLQWKPICYIQKIRDITDSIDVNSYKLIDQPFNSSDRDPVLENSLLWAFYGSDLDSLDLQSFNISFGTKKDGFYNKAPHISWTHMAGYGSPPEDYVSLLVILVVSIGFGIPLLIIVISSIYIIYKRLSKPRDEILLGH